MRISRRRLRAMIDEATVDAYNDSELTTGWYTMIEQNLGLPFETTVLGVVVSVIKVDVNERDEIVVICMRAKARQVFPVLDLPLPEPPPPGAEWIEAYRHWLRA